MGDHALLERVLVEADPARTARDAAPDAEARRIRDRIIRTAAAPHPRRRVALSWASGLAVAAAAAVVAVVVALPHGAAVADTPRPLDFTDAGSVTATVDAARDALVDGEGPASPERLVTTASWTFSLDDALIAPQLSILSWEADLSGSVLTFDGVPYDPADAEANQAEVVSRGEVSSELVMQPGDFNTPVPDPPGDSRDAVVAMLRAFGMPEQPSAFEVTAAISAAVDQWTLTDAQQSEMLGLLEESDGVSALGTATDRLGREVTGLRVIAPDGGVSDVLLLSADTGRIVGSERTALVADDVIPAGAITGYRMWDVDEEVIR